MVGLSVVLENQKSGNSNIISKKTSQVISKSTMLINSRNYKASSSSSSCVLLSTNPRTDSELNYPVPVFLQQCFLCRQKLLPGKDIYMYKGDRAFCSVECRCRQIFMDEEESLKKKENCSLAAMKPSTSSSSSSSSVSSSPSSTSSSASRHHRKAAARNRAGGFAY